MEQQFANIPPERPSSVACHLEHIEGVGGVYGIWEGQKICYFGATCHLNHRMNEIMINGRHHSLSLLMGKRARGTTGRNRAAWFRRSQYRISWMVVPIGRTEFEEYMVLKHTGTLKNHQGGRFSLRSDYPEWQKLVSPSKALPKNRQQSGTPFALSSESQEF